MPTGAEADYPFGPFDPHKENLPSLEARHLAQSVGLPSQIGVSRLGLEPRTL